MSLFLQALAWLGDAANWRGAGGIPLRAGEHLAITVVAVALAALIAVPAGVIVGHSRRGAAAVRRRRRRAAGPAVAPVGPLPGTRGPRGAGGAR